MKKNNFSVGIVMDPIEHIHAKKDTTLAILWALQDAGHPLFYMQCQDIFYKDGQVHTAASPLQVHRSDTEWFHLDTATSMPLQQLPLVLMRKDPPVTAEYIYATQLLAVAQKQGTVVCNRPESLLLFNEKLLVTQFPELAPPFLISAKYKDITAFLQLHGTIVLKPLHGMAGASIFKVSTGDLNLPVMVEMLTFEGQRPLMAQRFIPEIAEGDKRIFMVGGKPIPHTLARIPAVGDLRGNLARGATGVVQPLSKRDAEIAKTVGPFLLEHGLHLAGLDVIGDYVSEINITSPTCLREISAATSKDFAVEVAMYLSGLMSYS